MMRLLESICHIGDFWLQFGPQRERELLATEVKRRRRAGQLAHKEAKIDGYLVTTTTTFQ